MAELTSTKIYGDLQVARNLNVSNISNVLYVDNVNGRIGIMQSSPAYNLDVTGNLRTTGRAYTAGLSTTSAIYGSSSIDIGNNSGSNFRHGYFSGTVYADDSLVLGWEGDAQTLTSSADGIYTAANFGFGNESAPDCAIDSNGTIRSTAQGTPNGGTGLEMYWTGSAAYVHPYNRTSPGYVGELNLRGTTVNIDGGHPSASTVYPVLDCSSTGLVFNNGGSSTMDFRARLGSSSYGLYARGSDAKVGMGEMVSETEATYKMLNLRFYEANYNDRLNNVGAVAENSGMLLYNDYTVYSHASIDFVTDTTYATSYNAGRFGWYGYGTTSTATDYNYFFWTGYSGSAHWETMRLHRLGNLYVRADVVAYSTVITSDERLKKNIENIDDNILDKLMKLRPVTFEWKDETKRGDERVSGLIAQEVEDIFPELISESPNLGDGANEEEDKTQYKHVRYNELIPYLTKGMQQQQKIIDNQQKEIDDLKQKVELLLEKL